METATPFRQLFHRDLVVPVASDQRYPRVLSSLRDIGHIDHALIHADASQNRCAVSMNQDITLSREISRIAIAVSGANRRDPHRTIRHKGSAVADRRARLHFLNIGNKAADLHRRVNLHVSLYLIRRIQTVYRDTGSRRIQSHPRQFHDRRAVRTVAHRNMNACIFQTFMEFLVPLIL